MDSSTITQNILPKQVKKMKLKTLLLTASLATITLTASANLMFSQYAEDGDIKGVEIWNNSASEITFSGSNTLSIMVYANGSTSTSYTFNKTSGSIGAGSVLVFADGSANSIWTDSGIAYEEANVNFNGDDAVELRLNGSVVDMIGIVGSDPGVSWLGGGVETRDQNIELISSITSGAPSGFTDPSTRFSTVSTDPLDSNGGTVSSGTDLFGFGIAPIPEPSVAALMILGMGFLFRFMRKK